MTNPKPTITKIEALAWMNKAAAGARKESAAEIARLREAYSDACDQITLMREDLSRAAVKKELLTSERWRRDLLAACAIYDNDQHEGNYGMGGGTPRDGANIVFEAIDRALLEGRDRKEG